ncbi:MAG: head maturation protease, ClpP-related [Hydrogenophaga sp.]|uniref:head maturation protease, ClpP-related n=1 Tax=Hydrogenophaga sp. TaxID=1904254 RepID=UPI0040375AD9
MKNFLKLLRNNATVERVPLNLVANEDKSEATFYLYDVIAQDWGIGALDVINALAGLDSKTTVRMRIKSPGGDVFEARAIVTAMRAFMANGGKIIAQIDSIAASAASWIALNANEVEIVEGAFLMIHKASGACWGTDVDMHHMGDLLNKVEGVIINEYAARTKQTPEQILTWMAAETWFTAQEAVDNGFATRVISTLAEHPSNLAKLAWNLTSFEKTPEALLNLKPSDPAPDDKAILEQNQRRMRLLDLNT